MLILVIVILGLKGWMLLNVFLERLILLLLINICLFVLIWMDRRLFFKYMGFWLVCLIISLLDLLYIYKFFLEKVSYCFVI